MKLITPQEAVVMLNQPDGVVAVPTETVYGLAARIDHPEALRKIFTLKGRPSDNPLIVHIAHPSWVARVAREVSPLAQKLMDTFWPGALTLILPKQEGVSDVITAGLDTVAVRLPRHDVFRALLRDLVCPLAAPSANLSGKPSPTKPEHVAEDFGDTVPIIDGGACEYGLESTVVKVEGERVKILRHGAVTREQIEIALGVEVEEHSAVGKKPEAPGMKYRHYAPKSPVQLVSHDGVWAAYAHAVSEQKTIVLIATDEILKRIPGIKEVRISLGSYERPDAAAHVIFDALRVADRRSPDIIIVEESMDKGIGRAVRERLQKATQASNAPKGD